jgi:ribosome-associated heat shock protein Hsp15
MNEVRIDKWMWAMRIFKTRTLAVEACKKNRVLVNDIPAKPSRMIKTGDRVQVRKYPITYTYKALRLTDKRIGASLLSEYLEDITPSEQYELLELNKISGSVNRAKGTGRPTKKERRDWDDFWNDMQ